MNTLFGAAAAVLLGTALVAQTAQAQPQTLAPPLSGIIIAETPGASQPAYPYPYPPPPAYVAPPPVAYSYPPPPAAQPPSLPETGYGSSMAPGYRPMQPPALDFGNAQPSEENYR
jgi:hypothetical protein